MTIRRYVTPLQVIWIRLSRGLTSRNTFAPSRRRASRTSCRSRSQRLLLRPRPLDFVVLRRSLAASLVGPSFTAESASECSPTTALRVLTSSVLRFRNVANRRNCAQSKTPVAHQTLDVHRVTAVDGSLRPNDRNRRPEKIRRE
jgi:hypothetical protein